jgi:hypothetical protein
MFPILMHQKEWDSENIKKIIVPKTIPIEFVRQFQDQIYKNHGQSVERLAERGGLHPTELCAAMYGLDLYTYFGRKPMNDAQTVFSLAMIVMKLNNFKKEANYNATVQNDLSD